MKFKTVSDFKRLCPELFSKTFCQEAITYKGHLIINRPILGSVRVYVPRGKKLELIFMADSITEAKDKIQERILNGEDNPTPAGE